MIERKHKQAKWERSLFQGEQVEREQKASSEEELWEVLIIGTPDLVEDQRLSGHPSAEPALTVPNGQPKPGPLNPQQKD